MRVRIMICFRQEADADDSLIEYVFLSVYGQCIYRRTSGICMLRSSRREPRFEAVFHDR